MGGRSPTLRLARSPLWPRVILAALYLLLLTILVPWWLHNNLLKGDGAGHLFLVEFTAEHLLPFGTGWCDRVWGGFAVGQLYPPLFHLLGGVLARVTGAVVAVKLLVTATWLAIPLGLYLVTGVLASAADPSRPRPLLHGTLLLAGWCGMILPSQVLGIGETLGTNLESAVGNGMFPSAAGGAAWLFCLAALLRYGHRRPLRAAVPLALTVLLHPVWGLVAAATCAVAAGADLLSPEKGAGRTLAVRGWALAGLIAFSLSAFFSVPFLANAGGVHSTHIPLRWPLTLWWPVAAGAGLALLYWRRLPRPIRIVAGSAAVLLAFVAVGDAVGLAFHFYRLTIPLTLLALLLLSYLLYHPWSNAGSKGSGHELPSRTTCLLRGANFVMMLTLAAIFFLQGPVHPRGNPDLSPARLEGTDRLQGRIAVLTQPMHSPGYMALPWAVAAGGGAVSHGISAESARTARPIFGLLRKLSPDQFVWGVDMNANPAQRFPDPQGDLTRGQLNLLGFSHLLSDRRATAAATGTPPQRPPALLFPNFVAQDSASAAALERSHYLTPRGSSLAYYLHPLPGASLATTDAAFQPVPADRFDDLTERWFALAGEAPVPVVGLPDPVAPVFGCNVQATDISGSGDRLMLKLTGCPEHGAPVYIKIPYHGNWQATGTGGDDQLLLPAGYGMLLVAGEGTTSIEYTPGAADWIGRILTLLGLLLAGGMALCNQRSEAA